MSFKELLFGKKFSPEAQEALEEFSGLLDDMKCEFRCVLNEEPDGRIKIDFEITDENLILGEPTSLFSPWKEGLKEQHTRYGYQLAMLEVTGNMSFGALGAAVDVKPDCVIASNAKALKEFACKARQNLNTKGP